MGHPTNVVTPRSKMKEFLSIEAYWLEGQVVNHSDGNEVTELHQRVVHPKMKENKPFVH